MVTVKDVRVTACYEDVWGVCNVFREEEEEEEETDLLYSKHGYGLVSEEEDMCEK